MDECVCLTALSGARSEHPDFLKIIHLKKIPYIYKENNSDIRKVKYCPVNNTAAPHVSRSGYPPWTLKHGGLESWSKTNLLK